MSNVGLYGAVVADHTSAADPGGETPVPSIGEVTSEEIVVKCMGRTYSAVAADSEVAITDTTDITHLIPLGSARARDERGAWQVVTIRNEYVTTTTDLLRAVAALHESTDRAFILNHRANH